MKLTQKTFLSRLLVYRVDASKAKKEASKKSIVKMASVHVVSLWKSQ